MVDTVAEVPKLCILVPSLHGLPTRIRLYSEELGFIVVDVVYEGFLGQCFLYKQKGQQLRCVLIRLEREAQDLEPRGRPRKPRVTRLFGNLLRRRGNLEPQVLPPSPLSTFP